MSDSILIVDDERGIRETLSAVLRDEGFNADAVASGEDCLKAIARRAYGCVLLDVWLPGINGLETLAQMRELNCDAAVVIISGHGNIETAVRATKLGAFDFIEKPLSIEKTVLTVRNALRQRQLERVNEEMSAELKAEYEMVGESVGMRALRKQITVVAPTDGRVLISGESGAGKELVARAIHAQSRRAAAPFIEVNSAAIPEELIESELFGHVKGSFTGATAAKKGKFEVADGATLFLDEVSDMSPNVQAKVLRVLEEQRFEPVGSNTPISVDVRVIAATNKRLDEEIEKGTFRSDTSGRRAFAYRSFQPTFRQSPRQKAETLRRQSHRSDAALLVARQCSRAEKHHRARNDHAPASQGRSQRPAGFWRRRTAGVLLSLSFL